MKLYLINKLSKIGGMVVKRKPVLARSDRDALDQAERSDDCPVCEVLKDGDRIGSIL
jgi:hypothetical protein